MVPTNHTWLLSTSNVTHTTVDVILKFHLILIGLLDTCTHLNLLFSGPQENTANDNVNRAKSCK